MSKEGNSIIALQAIGLLARMEGHKTKATRKGSLKEKVVGFEFEPCLAPCKPWGVTVVLVLMMIQGLCGLLNGH